MMVKFFFVFLLFFFSLNLIAEIKITLREKIGGDYKNFYTRSHGLYYFSSIFLAGLFANTKADESISSFYQGKIRSQETDVISSYVKPFGNRSTMVGFLGVFFVMKAFDKLTKNIFPSIFVERVSRMLFVGVPLLLLTQTALGGTRPSALEPHSHWEPFQNSYAVSASGHSFFGALPFLALATMTESVFLRIVLIAASTMTAFSRLNDNQHYFSQIFLGWSLAFLSFDAVDTKKFSLRFLVKRSQEDFALGFLYQFQ
jgi:hypothetical protein